MTVIQDESALPGNESPTPTNGVGTITLLLADDHAMVLDALSERLDREPGFRVVGTATDAGDAVEQAAKTTPDVALIDIRMPGKAPAEAAREIAGVASGARIIFLSCQPSDRHIDSAVSGGARGVVSKADPIPTLVEAIRRVHAGEQFFSEEISARLAGLNGENGNGNGPMSRLASLSPREIEVLRYIASGLSKKRIAEEMKISVKTVDNHATSLMAKLDLHDRVSVARFAIREGLSEA